MSEETMEITEVLDEGEMPKELITQTNPVSSPLAAAGTIDELVGRYHLQSEFINKVMKEGIDYGKIPGAGDKKVLLKPGAEKITTLWGLSIQFPKELQHRIEDWTGADHGGEPFFFYEDTCRLTKDGVLIAEASGSCNSWEKKYRFRQPELICPTCGKGAIIKGKAEYGGGWVCWAKKGGCGAKFQDDTSAITEQDISPVKNEFVFDLVNTFKKMSQKRGLVAATLMAGNVSDHFTQDLEDMEGFGSSGNNAPAKNVEPAKFKVNFPKAKNHFGGNSPTIAELFGKDPDYCQWISQQQNDVGQAMRDFLETIGAVERQSADTGITTEPQKAAGNASAIKAVKQLGTMLKGVTGPLTPTIYWAQVRAIGMGQERAKEICDGLGKDDDWREVLTIAYKEMAGFYEEVK